jgi:hypothetical protein
MGDFSILEMGRFLATALDSFAPKQVSGDGNSLFAQVFEILLEAAELPMADCSKSVRAAIKHWRLEGDAEFI